MTGKSNDLHSGWTPAPWRDDSNREQVTANALDENDAVADVPRDTDRAIIALTPEMADLLLSLPIYPGTTHHIWVEALRLQGKLREIKETA